MANSFTGRLKRKGAADIEAEYSYGDVLASSKRFRLVLQSGSPTPLPISKKCCWKQSVRPIFGDPELPIFCEGQEFVGISYDDTPMQMSEMPNPVEIPELQQPAEPCAMAMEPQLYVPNDEKALVLYKPVNPPIFPGFPAAGSPDLPIKFNTSFLSNHKALEMQGMGNLPYLFRFERQSDSVSNLKTSETKPVDNRLAVVPWVPSQFSTYVQELSSDRKPGCDNVPEDEDQMIMDDENVVLMDEDSIQPPQTTMACNSVVNEVNTEGLQWQHCMNPQPPLKPQVMWSY